MRQFDTTGNADDGGRRAADVSGATPGAPVIRRRRLLAGAFAAGAVAVSAGTHRIATAVAGDRIDGGAAATARAVRVDPPAATGTFDPSARFVALYGFPGSTTLGALGEQDAEASADRVQQVAAAYASFGRPVVPTFELIASVAAADAGADGDYSNEFGFERFAPYAEVAARRGLHVVYDLQSGRSPFDQQIREYEQHLSFPNASVALDPEWRGDAPFVPGGGRIGTVDATEVNATIDWLDALIRRRGLPPKMLIVHQFTSSMITNTASIRGTDRVTVVLHMDGFGSLRLKRSSYSVMVSDLPPGALVGWKNFYDEDRPTPTPSQTIASTPDAVFISYQ